ncbi:hypothetical protein TVAG_254650 [Trichomonas vaginalis G3]|uniref:DUF3447 domain-containing protein n=1 Tax=Trichomonas vaginalis (strain ATCC PRA-98 / G3) TaxID=412133 RepID=A2G6V4_TRIV3|nr:protein ubiquitination [Trichomonas vaginalis G3]EAX87111.1 hypothetical protein TVAG_254650 [Trichomonas vaginalis G3]KAI5527507.1 protein ubiquitination [Trichomonas vaginalis G3]|eukprot:XP_001300041.1 hypothetical protein [Trichomonas vaginalis G3]
MSGSTQPANEIECSFCNIKLIDAFEYPSQASKLIWDVNSENILQASSQIIDFINTNKIPIKMAIYLIDIISQLREKNIKLLADLYQAISNKFSCTIQPRNEKLTSLLHYRGFKFANFRPKMKEEDIINVYSIDSALHYIAYDKVDELKIKFPYLDIAREINEITPLDCAIKYGSELCFNYFKNLGAKYTDKSELYAVQGGNTNIFMQMIEDKKSFNYRQYEIAEYLKSNFRQNPDSIAESMFFGNYDVASYLLSNGGNINKLYIIFHIIFIIILLHPFYSHIYHCFITFFFISCSSLLYDILFHFIFIIVS